MCVCFVNFPERLRDLLVLSHKYALSCSLLVVVVTPELIQLTSVDCENGFVTC